MPWLSVLNQGLSSDSTISKLSGSSTHNPHIPPQQQPPTSRLAQPATAAGMYNSKVYNISLQYLSDRSMNPYAFAPTRRPGHDPQIKERKKREKKGHKPKYQMLCQKVYKKMNPLIYRPSPGPVGWIVVQASVAAAAAAAPPDRGLSFFTLFRPRRVNRPVPTEPGFEAGYAS